MAIDTAGNFEKKKEMSGEKLIHLTIVNKVYSMNTFLKRRLTRSGQGSD